MACLEIDSKGIPKTFQACFEWWQSYWNTYDRKNLWAFVSDVSEFQHKSDTSYCQDFGKFTETSKPQFSPEW